MKTPDIVLVNPWIHDFAAYDLWLKPVGLLSIATLLQEHGCNVHMIDCLDIEHPAMRHSTDVKQPARKKTGKGHFYKTEIQKPEALQQFSRPYFRYGILPSVLEADLSVLPKPDAFIVSSMMTYWYPGVQETIASLKRVHPEVPVLLGGVYATLCTSHAERISGADAVFSGHCNKDFFTLLSQKTGFDIGFPENYCFPQPDCSLLSSKSVIPLITSHGCPYTCTYCASKLLFNGFEQRDYREILAEIEHWHKKAGALDFAFYDDALLMRPEQHSIPLMKEIIRRGFTVRFHVPNGLHIRNINQEIADLMCRSGFKTLRLGLETADPALQKATGGKVSREQFIQAAGCLHRAGYTADQVGVYILGGLPFQRYTNTLEAVRFVHDAGLRPYVAEYSPIPGTSLWNDAVSCSPFPIADEPLFHNNTLLPCRWEYFTTDHLQYLKEKSRAASRD